VFDAMPSPLLKATLSGWINRPAMEADATVASRQICSVERNDIGRAPSGFEESDCERAGQAPFKLLIGLAQ
jgi:hypothetical protein